MVDEEELVKGKMQNIARLVHKELPENFGFIVLAFKFNEKGQMIYTTNANQQDIALAMEEFIQKTKDNFGNDTGKY